jgi:hypothetical protein
MSTARFHLKQPRGWFAAGREAAGALTLLSDTAFKVFVWICLHAERGQGTLRSTAAEMARAIGKPETEVVATLEKLVQKGVCNRIADTMVEITDRFWPYERMRPQEAPGSLSAYLGRVRHVFLQRCCVRSAFTAADEKLLVELFRKGVPIENAERAILLGSLRKYVALLNHGHGTPITTLHYFTDLFEEVNQLQISTQYWDYVAYKLRGLEQRWCNSRLPDSIKAHTETK